MRVLVAGGAGFVGSHLVDRLLAAGHEVVCVDDLSTGSPRNIAHLDGHARFRFIETDVATTPDLAVDRVFHLASPASPVDYDRLPLETLAANSRGTWRLLDLARACGAHLLYASTSEVYGDPLVHPQSEAYWGNVDPIGPRSCYDEAKRFGEALLMAHARTEGTSAVIVRIFNTYGPRMRVDDGRVIPDFISAALAGRPMTVHGDGHQTRSFCYVDDLVEGILAVGLDAGSTGGVFNLGNPDELSMLELAERIRDRIDPGVAIAHVPARPGDPGRRRPVIDRVRDAYGWEPRVDLDEGLAATVADFRSRAEERISASIG